MKKLIPFFLILIGCDSNNNEVTITKEEFKKFVYEEAELACLRELIKTAKQKP